MAKHKTRSLFISANVRHEREHVTRRKGNKPDVSNTLSTKMLWFLFMISLSNLCQGASTGEIRISGAEKGGLRAANIGTNGSPPTTEFSWVIEHKECEHLDNGCFCERKSSNWITVKCRCDNEAQVAHLKSPGRDNNPSSVFERWTWRFEDCSRLVLHSRFLHAVDGSHFQVEFHNISNLTVQDSAFEKKESYNQVGPNQVSILINHCKIDTLPTKAFPSYVHSIRLRGCDIQTIEKRFIYSLKLDKVTIQDCKIHNINSGAFYNETFIDTLTVHNSTIVNILPNGVASALNRMQWVDSTVSMLDEHAFSGSVATVTWQNSLFETVESNGFSIKMWSQMVFSNNTFKQVKRRGIDLSHYSETVVPSVDISDNSWKHVDRDFIATGSSETNFITVTANAFLHQCDCGNTLSSLLSMNGSRLWFHQEILNNSRCRVSEKALDCLQSTGHLNTSDSNLLPNDALYLLCDTEVYMCINDVSEVEGTSHDDTNPGRPQLRNRLRVLAYFIAAMGVFIIASLLITMCVFLCRKKTPRKKSPPDSPHQDLEHAQGKKSVMAKSMSGGEYADIVFKHQNASARPRSMLLEDIAMEDKGVQTMPTELSSEVLEGLREKLSRPDSFWDAKETIDHLYDLIQVKELNSALSSPPDVTMCNGQSTTASTARLLPSTSSSPVAQVSSAGVSVSIGGSDCHILQSSNAASNTSSPVSDTPPPLPATSPPIGVPLIQRYAQIRNKAKTAPLCEYADPSDSSMHIYSELTHQHPSEEKNGVIVTTPNGKIPSPNPLPQNRERPSPKSSFLGGMRAPLPSIHGAPILCEYTDPKDVQTHVYAELSNNPQSRGGLSKSTTSSPVKKASPSKTPISLSHKNTITIAVPPPPVNIPHSSSFHSSPRLLGKIRENEISSSNPSLATRVTTPVKIIHVNDLEAGDPRQRLPSDKLKRSVSSVDSCSNPKMISNLLSGNGIGGSDTQKRPLPSIPSWSSKMEGKSQL